VIWASNYSSPFTSLNEIFRALYVAMFSYLFFVSYFLSHYDISFPLSRSGLGASLKESDFA
jgi:hypothetical protein